MASDLDGNQGILQNKNLYKGILRAKDQLDPKCNIPKSYLSKRSPSNDDFGRMSGIRMRPMSDDNTESERDTSPVTKDLQSFR